jgi:hypothetical protein
VHRKVVVTWGQNGSEVVGFSTHAISDSRPPLRLRLIVINVCSFCFTGDTCTGFWRQTNYNSVCFECLNWVSY